MITSLLMIAVVAAIVLAIIAAVLGVLIARGVREDREAYPPMPPEEVAAKVEAWRGSSSCSKCRTSRADGGPMICDRDGCPGESARAERELVARHDRAWERGEYVDRAAGIEEKRERLRDWDLGTGD